MPDEFPYGEKQLLSRIAGGDPSVYPYLHDTYYNSLVFFSLRIIENQQQAEDIAIESLIRIWQSPAVFDSIGKLRGYLFTSVKNASLNYLKHLKSKEKSQRFFSSAGMHDHSKFETLLIEADVMRLLYKEIQELPEIYRQVIELLYFEDIPPAEVARRLGISRENLRQRKGRAVKELKSALIRKGFGGLLLFLLFF